VKNISLVVFYVCVQINFLSIFFFFCKKEKNKESLSKFHIKNSDKYGVRTKQITVSSKKLSKKSKLTLFLKIKYRDQMHTPFFFTCLITNYTIFFLFGNSPKVHYQWTHFFVNILIVVCNKTF